MHTGKQYRVAWIGRRGTRCDDILERLVAQCRAESLDPIISRAEQFDRDCLGDQDRMVLVCPDRSEYPSQAVQALCTTPNIVPWGVVTGSWHIGSRRSGGMGPICHWQQPWFRWWDCWMGWFFPHIARPSGRVPGGYGPVITPQDMAQSPYMEQTPTTDQLISILCACPTTAQMWSAQARHAGWQARLYRTIDAFLDDPHASCTLVFWDDSSLPCLLQENAQAEIRQQWDLLLERIPATRLIGSLGLEHLDLWVTLQRLGCREILMKPSYALSLTNYLYHQSVQRHVA